MANLDGTDNAPKSNERPTKESLPRKTHGRAMLARANKTQRKTFDSGTENESSDDESADEEDEEALEEEDEDGDDESDQPAVFAPPRGHKRHSIREAGRLAEYRRMFRSQDPVLYEDPNELFGGGSIEDDDDDLYRAVDDISDEDEQNDETFHFSGADVPNYFLDHSESLLPFQDAEHEADFILAQVDGLSAYGFGEDVETGDGSGEFSAQSEAGDITAATERHVHFGSDVEHMTAYAKPTSPSLTRALLPSALPFEDEVHHFGLGINKHTPRRNVSVFAEDTYDSMFLNYYRFSFSLTVTQVMLLRCSVDPRVLFHAIRVSPRPPRLR
jgi:hypothetical protein